RRSPHRTTRRTPHRTTRRAAHRTPDRPAHRTSSWPSWRVGGSAPIVLWAWLVGPRSVRTRWAEGHAHGRFRPLGKVERWGYAAWWSALALAWRSQSFTRTIVVSRCSHGVGV